MCRLLTTGLNFKLLQRKPSIHVAVHGLKLSWKQIAAQKLHVPAIQLATFHVYVLPVNGIMAQIVSHVVTAVVVKSKEIAPQLVTLYANVPTGRRVMDAIKVLQ